MGLLLNLLNIKVVSLVRNYAVYNFMPVDYIFHNLLDSNLSWGPVYRKGKSIARKNLFLWEQIPGPSKKKGSKVADLPCSGHLTLLRNSILVSVVVMLDIQKKQ